MEARSKAPSVVNGNNVSSISQPVGEGKLSVVGTGSSVTVPIGEIKSKENIKIEPKMNNFIGTSSDKLLGTD